MPRTPQSTAGTILLAEDEALLRELGETILSQAGYKVVTAAGADELRKLVAESPAQVDLLLTDVLMPGMRGTELAQRICVERPGIRVIFATGYFSQARDAETLGKLLFKPVRANEIRSAFDEMLQGAH